MNTTSETLQIPQKFQTLLTTHPDRSRTPMLRIEELWVGRWELSEWFFCRTADAATVPLSPTTTITSQKRMDGHVDMCRRMNSLLRGLTKSGCTKRNVENGTTTECPVGSTTPPGNPLDPGSDPTVSSVSAVRNVPESILCTATLSPPRRRLPTEEPAHRTILKSLSLKSLRLRRLELRGISWRGQWIDTITRRQRHLRRLLEQGLLFGTSMFKPWLLP